MNILIKDFCSTALSEANGIILRQKIEEFIPNLTDDTFIILDFSDIRLYASPFFNACISFLVNKYSPDFVLKKLKLENITELGEKTYLKSYNNAVEDYRKGSKNNDIIGNIVDRNIQES